MQQQISQNISGCLKDRIDSATECNKSYRHLWSCSGLEVWKGNTFREMAKFLRCLAGEEISKRCPIKFSKALAILPDQINASTPQSMLEESQTAQVQHH